MADWKELMASLEKEYTTAIRTKKRDLVKFPALSSGSLLMDSLLGIGGWPKGRVIEIFGREGCGKCVDLNTMVLTQVGYQTLREVAEKQLNTPEGSASPLRQMVRGIENRPLASSHYYNAGTHDRVMVTTVDGHALGARADHRIRIINKKGRLAYATMDELETRDHVVMNTNAGACSPMLVTEDMAEKAMLYGVLAGTNRRPDGTVLQVVDPDFQKVALNLLRKEWNEDDVAEEDFTVATGELLLTDTVEDFIGKKDLRNHIPREIRTGAKAVQFAYLRVLFKARMHWGCPTTEMTLYSDSLSQEVQLMSENWGVQWGRFKTMDTGGNPEWKMYIKGLENARSLCAVLGEDRWQAHEWKTDPPRQFPYQYDNVVYAMQVLAQLQMVSGIKEPDPKQPVTESYVAAILARLQARKVITEDKELKEIVETWKTLLCKNTRTNPIASIEWGSAVPMGDLTIPNAEHYCTAAFISHNSTLAMTTVKQAALEPAPQNFTAFFDFEHAFDKDYARRIHIPVDDEERFLLIRPDSLEDGADIFWKLHETGRMALAVFDSVPAMTPEAMMKQATGDSETGVQIGLQAAKLKELLMGITKRISTSGTVVLLINQLRAKISMTGNMGIYKISDMQRWKVPNWFLPLEEDTAGGWTVKYMTTTRVRMDMVRPMMAERINDITGEKESQPIGNIVNMTLVKHKVAAPFKRGKVMLEYGVGFDNTGIVLDVGKAKGVIKVNKQGFYEVTLKDGVLKGRGTEDLVSKLKSDPKLMGRVMQMIGFSSVGHMEAMFPKLSDDIIAAAREDAPPEENIDVPLPGEGEEVPASKEEEKES